MAEPIEWGAIAGGLATATIAAIPAIAGGLAVLPSVVDQTGKLINLGEEVLGMHNTGGKHDLGHDKTDFHTLEDDIIIPQSSSSPSVGQKRKREDRIIVHRNKKKKQNLLQGNIDLIAKYHNYVLKNGCGGVKEVKYYELNLNLRSYQLNSGANYRIGLASFPNIAQGTYSNERIGNLIHIKKIVLHIGFRPRMHAHTYEDQTDKEADMETKYRGRVTLAYDRNANRESWSEGDHTTFDQLKNGLNCKKIWSDLWDVCTYEEYNRSRFAILYDHVFHWQNKYKKYQLTSQDSHWVYDDKMWKYEAIVDLPVRYGEPLNPLSDGIINGAFRLLAHTNSPQKIDHIVFPCHVELWYTDF